MNIAYVNRYPVLAKLVDKYDIPLEAVVKSDLLRLGVSFTPEALKYAAAFKAKSYFIFSFDRVTQESLSKIEKHAAPEEMALIGGPYDFKRTIVSTRLNPKSPYQVTPLLCKEGLGEGDYAICDLPRLTSPYKGEEFLGLFYNSEKICNIQLLERPEYYKKALKSRKPVSDISPTIEWGYLIYITAFRLCQYWGAKEECQFCDINENYRQQKKERSYTAIKPIDETIEALAIINEIGRASCRERV